MIKLGDITLPQDLAWISEFDWTPVRQSQTVSLTGKLIIEEAVQLAGRPITLSGGQEVWVKRSTLIALHTLATQVTNPLNLTYHDTTLQVVFNHSATAIEARPVVPYSNPDDDAWYTLTLRLIEV